MCLCMSDEGIHLNGIFSLQGDTPSNLKIKINIHVNLYIREKIATIISPVTLIIGPLSYILLFFG